MEAALRGELKGEAAKAEDSQVRRIIYFEFLKT